MCFTATFASEQEAAEFAKGQIATRNMRVYKIVYGPYTDRKGGAYYHSMFQCFKYYRGYHYYQTGKNAIGLNIYGLSAPLGEHVVIINEGLHAYTGKKDPYNGRCIAFIIPKGARYWKHPTDGFIVSTDLILY